MIERKKQLYGTMTMNIDHSGVKVRSIALLGILSTKHSHGLESFGNAALRQSPKTDTYGRFFVGAQHANLCPHLGACSPHCLDGDAVSMCDHA